MAQPKTQDWDVWYPKSGATGLSFGRGRLDPTNVLLVHAAPPILTVTVRDGQGRTLARGVDLKANGETPITRLTRRRTKIERADIWPTDDDLSLPVLLAGGEVGLLDHWWHAADHSEWRWRIELYNHR